MKATNYCLCTALFVSVLSFMACQKDSGRGNMAMAPPFPPPPGDPFTQNIYTINPVGNSSPAIILCTPFNLTIPEMLAPPGLLLIMDQDGKVLQKKNTEGT